MATKEEVSGYIRDTLDPVGERLGVDYDAAADRVLLMFGLDDFADLPDGWRLVAEFVGWDRAMVAAMQYDFSADGGTYNRSQLYDMIKDKAGQTRGPAFEYLDEVSGGSGAAAYAVVVSRMVDPTDRYGREWESLNA